MNDNIVSCETRSNVHPKIARLMASELGEDIVRSVLENVQGIYDDAPLVMGAPELLVRTYGLFEAARVEMFCGDTQNARAYFLKENLTLPGRPVDYHTWENGDRLLFESIMRAAYGVYI